MKKLVIFDLDGTLLDTIADLANATNYALEQLGFPTHEISAYNFFVGNGIYKLFERALPEGYKTESYVMKMRELFLPYYEKNNDKFSKPYDGINELLGNLNSKNIKLAVASNKYQLAVEKMVMHFFPHIVFDSVYGQRDGIPHKPDPTVIFDIIKDTGINANDILYVGDSGVDMQTAINAKVDSCGVTWGLRPKSELEKFNPTYIIDHPSQILDII